MAWAMRGVKAEGGWAVVSTEEVEIHPTSDLAPFIEGRLWDDHDIPPLELITRAVHEYGALAAVELVHAGMNANNLYSREISIAPSHIANPASYAPGQAPAMRKSDIRDYRRWHRNAALRARRAGFDIIYVYAGHGLSLPMHFLQARYNQRTDEYGGNLVNRVRLHRRGFGRKAARGRPRRHTRHSRRARFRLDRQHVGAARHPEAATRTRCSRDPQP